MVRPFIKGNRLEAHITGLTPVPPRMISEGAAMIPNPVFIEWKDVDQLLVGWLRNNMTLEVATQLLHCQTSFDLWTGARDLCCAAMKSRVMNLQGELHQAKKNSLKMYEYLGKMKTMSDQLSLAGAPVSTHSVVSMLITIPL